jgi:hypothetical protein
MMFVVEVWLGTPVVSAINVPSGESRIESRYTGNEMKESRVVPVSDQIVVPPVMAVTVLVKLHVGL